MQYLIGVCITFTSFVAACSQLPRADDTPSRTVDAVEVDGEQLQNLSLRQLIDRLPPADTRPRWDDDLQTVVEHPASEEMRRRLITGTELSDDQWRQALFGTGAIKYQQQWPMNESYRLSLTVPDWLDLTEIRLAARGVDLRPASAGTTLPVLCGNCYEVQLRYERAGRPMGTLPEGTTELVFDVEIERGTMRWNPPRNVSPKPGVLWKGTITLPVQLVEAVDEQLEKLSLDDLIDRLPPAGSEWRRDCVSPEGAEHPASQEMRRRLLAGAELSDDQWRRALLGTGAIRYRHRWPKDESYRLSMTVPRWLDLTQIRLAGHDLHLRPVEAGELFESFSGTFPMMRARDARAGVPMGPLPEWTTQIDLIVEMERGKSLFLPWDEQEIVPKPGILWEGTITLPVTVVDSVEEMTTPLDHDTLRAAVRDAVGAGFRSWADEDQLPFVVIDPDCERFPILKTTGLDIKVELLQDDVVIVESWLVASDSDRLALTNSIRSSPTRFYGSANLRIDQGEADPTKWVLRLTGKNDHIQYLWHAENHWSGSLTIPWSEAVEHERMRTAECSRGPEMSTPRWR